MFSEVLSGGVTGIEGMFIKVETDISNGLPVFNMVGYLSSCVREAGERVRTALKNAQFFLPPKRITINLSPADIKKNGTGFDLPIALGILVCMGVITQEQVNGFLIIGELGLDGKVNGVNGVLPIIHYGYQKGIRRCIVPSENAGEAALVSGMEVIPVKGLREAVAYLNESIAIEPAFADTEKLLLQATENGDGDFSEIKGQAVLKRGMEIAASGMHNILMTGEAGAGKSMIAKRLPTILPCLTYKECLEITKIYSVAGLLKDGQMIISRRPFRSPHHTITAVALAGGGREPVPGEISLSHRGVLFLDELPEFNRNALEVMRQPLEDREVTISRINGTYRFPADFMLVAARNSCPCGYYPDLNKCTCTWKQIKQYNARISGPLLDRIDIKIHVAKLTFQELFDKKNCEDSQTIRERVLDAHKRQQFRYRMETIHYNSQLEGQLLSKYIKLGSSEEQFHREVFERMELSARGSSRLLKIARTIADMDGSETILERHMKEAAFYLEGK